MWKKGMEEFIKVAYKMWDKMIYVLSHVWGWVSLGFISIIAYFQPAYHIYWAIIAIIGIDAVMGVAVSIKKGSYALSYLGKETSWKVVFYTLLFMAIFIFEEALGSDINIGLYLAFSIAGAFELLSILANGTIIKPNFPLFKVLAKYIQGEIARKLGLPVEEIEKAIQGDLSDLKSERERKYFKKKGEKNDKGI